MKRDGETLATTVDPTYVDETIDEVTGDYIYTVYAVGANGQLSTGVSCHLTYDYTSVAEDQNANVNVYPNPANEMLTINVNVNNFRYQLINSLGQVVCDGNANQTAVVNVSELTKGVYFLRVNDGSNITTKKVVVE